MSLANSSSNNNASATSFSKRPHQGLGSPLEERTIKRGRRGEGYIEEESRAFSQAGRRTNPPAARRPHEVVERQDSDDGNKGYAPPAYNGAIMGGASSSRSRRQGQQTPRDQQTLRGQQTSRGQRGFRPVPTGGMLQRFLHDGDVRDNTDSKFPYAQRSARKASTHDVPTHYQPGMPVAVESGRDGTLSTRRPFSTRRSEMQTLGSSIFKPDVQSKGKTNPPLTSPHISRFRPPAAVTSVHDRTSSSYGFSSNILDVSGRKKAAPPIPFRQETDSPDASGFGDGRGFYGASVMGGASDLFEPRESRTHNASYTSGSSENRPTLTEDESNRPHAAPTSASRDHILDGNATVPSHLTRDLSTESEADRAIRSRRLVNTKEMRQRLAAAQAANCEKSKICSTKSRSGGKTMQRGFGIGSAASEQLPTTAVTHSAAMAPMAPLAPTVPSAPVASMASMASMIPPASATLTQATPLKENQHHEVSNLHTYMPERIDDSVSVSEGSLASASLSIQERQRLNARRAQQMADDQFERLSSVVSARDDNYNSEMAAYQRTEAEKHAREAARRRRATEQRRRIEAGLDESGPFHQSSFLDGREAELYPSQSLENEQAAVPRTPDRPLQPLPSIEDELQELTALDYDLIRWRENLHIGWPDIYFLANKDSDRAEYLTEDYLKMQYSMAKAKFARSGKVFTPKEEPRRGTHVYGGFVPATPAVAQSLAAPPDPSQVLRPAGVARPDLAIPATRLQPPRTPMALTQVMELAPDLTPKSLLRPAANPAPLTKQELREQVEEGYRKERQKKRIAEEQEIERRRNEEAEKKAAKQRAEQRRVEAEAEKTRKKQAEQERARQRAEDEANKAIKKAEIEAERQRQKAEREKEQAEKRRRNEQRLVEATKQNFKQHGIVKPRGKIAFAEEIDEDIDTTEARPSKARTQRQQSTPRTEEGDVRESRPKATPKRHRPSRAKSHSRSHLQPESLLNAGGYPKTAGKSIDALNRGIAFKDWIGYTFNDNDDTPQILAAEPTPEEILGPDLTFNVYTVKRKIWAKDEEEPEDDGDLILHLEDFPSRSMANAAAMEEVFRLRKEADDISVDKRLPFTLQRDPGPDLMETIYLTVEDKVAKIWVDRHIQSRHKGLLPVFRPEDFVKPRAFRIKKETEAQTPANDGSVYCETEEEPYIYPTLSQANGVAADMLIESTFHANTSNLNDRAAMLTEQKFALRQELEDLEADGKIEAFCREREDGKGQTIKVSVIAVKYVAPRN